MAKEKQSYSIKEVSEKSGVAQHVLRYWETEFSVLKPRKNLSGRREYSKIDLDLILKIKHLLYDEQYTIAGARKRLSGKAGGAGGEAVKNLLEEITKELKSIIELLE